MLKELLEKIEYEGRPIRTPEYLNELCIVASLPELEYFAEVDSAIDAGYSPEGSALRLLDILRYY